MQHMTSSRAKQNFGELLDALARGPVAIERHRKVKAIVCSPEAFREQSGPERVLAERRAARAAQQLVEKDRLIKHQKLAIDLLLSPEAKRAELIQRARAEIAKWRRDRLCSPDYADRWDELLDQPVEILARAMGSDSLDWGTALRQNSPWHVVVP
ncbi:type II toxin-antitoxin system Phd/YefM family antitoxin [Aquincola sp. S2]|uniref:Type II toxin-antitoxin system Phd/YefM family antitoxin n=1 Tax=Pseudaquabacterium terrae TaxID=2732868 RepID=A0ABX2EIU4_9BURK|nr:type II toxin-antitoxin system Phd/YefM family antitoxin [Aquabacterium terrae]NRF68533.1 type II toxin-antitoxin system Phd/YefM family antitoxin [Aquabacterium terrae]